MESQHIVNMLDAEQGTAAPMAGVWGLIVFAAIIIGGCAYLALKLPRRGDYDKEQ